MARVMCRYQPCQWRPGRLVQSASVSGPHHQRFQRGLVGGCVKPTVGMFRLFFDTAPHQQPVAPAILFPTPDQSPVVQPFAFAARFGGERRTLVAANPPIHFGYSLPGSGSSLFQPGFHGTTGCSGRIHKRIAHPCEAGEPPTSPQASRHQDRRSHTEPPANRTDRGGFHPITTWMTPCIWRRVKNVGTCTRRQIIGLTPSSHSLICKISQPPQTGTAMASVGLSANGCCRLLTRQIIPPQQPSPTLPHALHGWLLNIILLEYHS